MRYLSSWNIQIKGVRRLEFKSSCVRIIPRNDSNTAFLNK